MNRYDELARTLFDPVGESEFFADYWCRKPVYCRGTPERFAGLFGISELSDALLGDMTQRAPGPRGGPVTRHDVMQTGARRPPIAVKAYYNTASGRGGEILNVPLNQAMALFDAGLTLCASGLERNSEPLATFVAAVRERARFTGTMLVNGYYSPDGQGFNWHYDCQHVFILQLDGEKTWQFSDTVAFNDPPFNLPLEVMHQPGAAAALSQLGIRLTVPSEPSTIEQVLAPGDLLYLPPGTWHRAFARGQSFALSLTLVPLSFGDLLRTVLGFLTLSREPWRKDLNQRPSLGDHPLPAHLGDHLRDCLADVQRVLDQLSPEELIATCDRIRDTPMIALAVREVMGRS